MRVLPGPACAAAAGSTAPRPRRVLLTNDDGPKSPFFPAWARRVRDVLGWDAVCCTPAANQSFVSKALGQQPQVVRRLGPAHWEVEGSPAACVNIALYILPQSECDLVLSGPNLGHNLGRGSILSSGTVGAALEGALAGRRAIAISFPFLRGWNNWTEDDIEQATQDAAEVVQRLWRGWDEAAALYNVNVPLDFRDGGGARPVPEARMTSVAASSYTRLYRRDEAASDPGADSETYVWDPQNLRVFEAEAEEGSDIAAVKAGHISVSALLAGFGSAVLARTEGGGLG